MLLQPCLLGGAVSFCRFTFHPVASYMGTTMRQAQPLIAIALAALLALTGHSMAQARSAPGPDGHMILCTGTGPLAVLVDANGQPAGPAHICPDCAMSLFQIAMDAGPDMAAPTAWIKAQAVEFKLIFHTPEARPAMARSPPGGA